MSLTAKTSLLMLSLVLLSPSCGPGADNRTVPDWLAGSWKLLRIESTNMESTGSSLDVSQSGVTMTYPGCRAQVTIGIDWTAPMHEASEYTMIVDSADCAARWDMDMSAGSVDTGVLWGEKWEGDLWLTRVSGVYPFTWIYRKS